MAIISMKSKCLCNMCILACNVLCICMYVCAGVTILLWQLAKKRKPILQCVWRRCVCIMCESIYHTTTLLLVMPVVYWYYYGILLLLCAVVWWYWWYDDGIIILTIMPLPLQPVLYYWRTTPTITYCVWPSLCIFIFYMPFIFAHLFVHIFGWRGWWWRMSGDGDGDGRCRARHFPALPTPFAHICHHTFVYSHGCCIPLFVLLLSWHEWHCHGGGHCRRFCGDRLTVMTVTVVVLPSFDVIVVMMSDGDILPGVMLFRYFRWYSCWSCDILTSFVVLFILFISISHLFLTTGAYFAVASFAILFYSCSTPPCSWWYGGRPPRRPYSSLFQTCPVSL